MRSTCALAAGVALVFASSAPASVARTLVIRLKSITSRIGSTAPIPVVGGTGRFAGAHGLLYVGKGTSPLNTYGLTLP